MPACRRYSHVSVAAQHAVAADAPRSLYGAVEPQGVRLPAVPIQFEEAAIEPCGHGLLTGIDRQQEASSSERIGVAPGEEKRAGARLTRLFYYRV